MCILNFLKSDLELSHDIYFPSKNAFLLIISPFSVDGAFFPLNSRETHIKQKYS